MNELLEFFTSLREAFPLFFEYLANSIVMAFGALGFVYFLGRMLNLLKKDTPRNIMASMFMLGLGFMLAYMKYGEEYDFSHSLFSFVLDNILYFTVACIIYVTICFNLYSRIDSFLDKKFGKDKPERKKKKEKK